MFTKMPKSCPMLSGDGDMNGTAYRPERMVPAKLQASILGQK
jgi:hypothetical protein